MVAELAGDRDSSFLRLLLDLREAIISAVEMQVIVEWAQATKAFVAESPPTSAAELAQSPGKMMGFNPISGVERLM